MTTVTVKETSETRGLPVELQIAIESDGWPAEDVLSAFCARIVAGAAHFLATQTDRELPTVPPELSLLFTDDAAIRAINAEWRGKDRPTNVLSFPAGPVGAGGIVGLMLGDIVFARETIAREARDLAKTFDDHLAHLVVHGYLHLFGYDHIEIDEAERMEALETRILATLGISDPYGMDDPDQLLMRQ